MTAREHEPAPPATLGTIARDPAFVVAALLALPAACGFAWAAQHGIAVRVPGSPLAFLLLFPLLEELAFRGFLQTALLHVPALAAVRGPGISGANLATAALFALAHLAREPAAWALATFAPGLVFGWMRDRHRRVLPAVLLHVLYNAAVYLGVALAS